MTCKLGVLLVVAAACGSCWGSEILYSSFSGTVVNFDSLIGSPTLGAGEQLTNQYAGLGVTFDVPGFGAFATNGALVTSSLLNSDPNVVWVNQGGGGGNAVGMNIRFSSPIHQIGTLFLGSTTGTFSIAVYDGDMLLETLTKSYDVNPNGIQEGFTAIERSENITRAVVYATNLGGANWNFSIDDLKFSEVPAPSSTGMMVLGGAFLYRRKR